MVRGRTGSLQSLVSQGVSMEFPQFTVLQSHRRRLCLNYTRMGSLPLKYWFRSGSLCHTCKGNFIRGNFLSDHKKLSVTKWFLKWVHKTCHFSISILRLTVWTLRKANHFKSSQIGFSSKISSIIRVIMLWPNSFQYVFKNLMRRSKQNLQLFIFRLRQANVTNISNTSSRL
jgi:hypothetical protein